MEKCGKTHKFHIWTDLSHIDLWEIDWAFFNFVDCRGKWDSIQTAQILLGWVGLKFSRVGLGINPSISLLWCSRSVLLSSTQIHKHTFKFSRVGGDIKRKNKSVMKLEECPAVKHKRLQLALLASVALYPNNTNTCCINKVQLLAASGWCCRTSRRCASAAARSRLLWILGRGCSPGLKGLEQKEWCGFTASACIGQSTGADGDTWVFSCIGQCTGTWVCPPLCFST